MKRFIKPALRAFFPLVNGILFDIPKHGKHPEKYDLKLRHQKMDKLFYKVSKALDAEYIILGKENIPDGAIFYVCNHLSASDPLVFKPVIDKTPVTFVSKIENQKSKLLKNAVFAIDGLFMDRDDLRQSLKVMQKVEESLKEGNLSWCIYAEGTRALDSSSLMNDMHHGSFRPAIKAKVPIVPVASFGSNIILKEKPIYKKYPIIFSFLKPIYPEEYEGMKTEEIAKLVQSRIQKEVSFKLRMIHHQEMLKQKKYRLHRLVS